MIHPSVRAYVTARRRPFTDPWLRRMGALFYAPFDTEHGSTVWSKGKGWVTKPSTETVDADGWFVDKRTGFLQPARANVLRIERLGALLEGSESNDVGASDYRDFSTANWTAANLTVDTDSVEAADGSTRTTNTLTATAADGTLINDLGVIASAAKVFSLWIRRKTGSGNIQLTLDNGANWETVSVNDDWTRFTTTRTVSNPDVGIRVVTDEDAVFVDFAQHEDGRNFATSNIVGGATRAADNLQYINTGGSIARAARGTFIAGVTPAHTSDAGSAATIMDLRQGDGSGGPTMRFDGSGGETVWRVRSGGGDSASISGTTQPARGTLAVVAGTWETDGFHLYLNGTEEGTADTSGAAPTGISTELYLGQDKDNANPSYANFAHALIFDRVLNPGKIGQVSREIEIRTQNQ